MKTLLIAGAAVLIAATGFATIAAAADQTKATPKGWNYEIKDGKRVPKADRKVSPDGSWREEIRQGKCVVVKEKSSAGEYKESRRCD